MNINYEKINSKYDRYVRLDTSKKNILILGSAKTRNERNNIINPINPNIAKDLYGEDSQLYDAYKTAYDITQMPNIYTVNCYTLDDYINILGNVIQYDFNFIVPVGMNFREILYSSELDEEKYFVSIILDALYETESLSTLIMTDYHASDYEDIDHFLDDQKQIIDDFININSNLKTLDKAGSNSIFVLNMLKDVKYSSVVLAAMLSINDSSKYLNYINLKPVYDLDKHDLPTFCNFVYFKYNYMLNMTNAENLINFRLKDDIYKRVLIDELIKQVLRILDLSEFKGKIYTKYVDLQIKTAITNKLKPYEKKIFKSYTLKNIRFVKLNVNTGYIYVELSIVPYDSFETLNIVMEV